MTKDKDTASHYDPDWTADYFDNYGIREWNRLIGSPVMEISLFIHTHYLSQYISKGDRVLEIGAGAGRFTQILAELGAQIVVGDISPGQLELNRKHARQFGFADAVEEWRLLDIVDMSSIPSSNFDIVVAYGAPLSYVLDKRDVALQECIRVLKLGGYLILSVASLWGSAHRRLEGVLSIPIENNQKITNTGDLSPETFPGREHFLHMFRASKLKRWLAEAGLTLKAVSASGCLSIGWDEYVETIRKDEEKWQELLRMELEASSDEGCLDMGTAIIGVAMK